ncbi:MAG: hypothetical protein ACE5FT_01375 [Candidatus Nanoarchaeia archaeon]
MKKNQKAMLTWGAIILAVILGFGFMKWQASGEDFAPIAKCLTQKGVKFYGAYWCPHCADQKAMFGDAVKYVPYIECASPTGEGQNPVCEAAGVESYPLWVFPDGERLGGAHPPSALAAKAGCKA